MEERPLRAASQDNNKENNSTLRKAVAEERSAQATGATTSAAIFRAFVKSGRRLAEIQVRYEQQPECPLTKREKPGEKRDYHQPDGKRAAQGGPFDSKLEANPQPQAPALPAWQPPS